MKKLTREKKIRIDKQLRRNGYRQGGHTVYMGGEEPIVVVVEGRAAHLPSGSKLPVPEEWWV